MRDIDPVMPACRLQKTLENHPFMLIFTRMQLIADIHPVLFKDVENGKSTVGQLLELGLNQPFRSL